MTELICGDCLDEMHAMPDNSVDLVMCSPPYEDCRLYGELKFKLKGQDWVDWCVERYLECVRVSRGLVAWVLEGKTKSFRYSATPLLLGADLHRAGVHLRKPPAFRRVGIAGSGGPDWLRNDYEFIICGSKGGKLPWSDSTAMGKPPKWKPGGSMTHRLRNGDRKGRGKNSMSSSDKLSAGARYVSIPSTDGDSKQCYLPPEIANPGNVITCLVGGGRMGNRLAHKNEAPYPEKLAEFFIRSFCPPGGVVLDPFVGSGTTCAVAIMNGRKAIGIDARQSQIDLTRERIQTLQLELT